MNLLFIDPMSYNNLEMYDVELLNHIDKDFEITFIGNIKLENRENLKRNIKFYPYFKYSDKKGVVKGLSYIFSINKIFCNLIRNKPSFIHFQWFKLYKFDLIFLRLIKIFFPQVKIFHTAHNCLPHNSGNKYKKTFKKIYRQCDQIIVHSLRTKKELIDELGISSRKINIIPHGKLIFPINEKEKHRTLSELQSNIDSKILKFGFLGRISDYKGIDLVVDAWLNGGLAKNPKIHLYIIGTGDHICLRKISRTDNVTLINRFVSDEEFAAYLDFIDIVVLPYRNISQSGVLLSALNHHKKVIVSDVGGLTQPFAITDVGWILNEMSSCCLYHTIQLAIDNQAKNVNWDLLDKFYSWERIGIITSGLYKRVLRI